MNKESIVGRLGVFASATAVPEMLAQLSICQAKSGRVNPPFPKYSLK